MAIPWIQLVKYAPSILSLTGDLLQRSRQLPDSGDGMGKRVEAMETELQRQAEALHALAGQVEGLTEAMAALRRALLAAVILGSTAFLLAGAALAAALLR